LASKTAGQEGWTGGLGRWAGQEGWTGGLGRWAGQVGWSGGWTQWLARRLDRWLSWYSDRSHVYIGELLRGWTDWLVRYLEMVAVPVFHHKVD
jgi:hypothetical protein